MHYPVHWLSSNQCAMSHDFSTCTKSNCTDCTRLWWQDPRPENSSNVGEKLIIGQTQPSKSQNKQSTLLVELHNACNESFNNCVSYTKNSPQTARPRMPHVETEINFSSCPSFKVYELNWTGSF